jgi:hypothetical protein
MFTLKFRIVPSPDHNRVVAYQYRIVGSRGIMKEGVTTSTQLDIDVGILVAPNQSLEIVVWGKDAKGNTSEVTTHRVTSPPSVDNPKTFRGPGISNVEFVAA